MATKMTGLLILAVGITMKFFGYIFVVIALCTIGLGNKQTEAASTCQQGDFLHPFKHICVPCKICQDHEFEKVKCEGTINRECKSCPNNTYLGIDKMCKNCTFCEQGFANPCNSTRDAVCKKANKKPDSFKRETIIIAVSVSVFLVSAIFGAVWYKRYRTQGEEAVPEEHDLMNGNGKAK